jgi:hypothetical protein
MEDAMKNIMKKISLAIAAFAMITVGAANLYANDNQWPVHQNDAEYQRFIDIRTGSGNF